MRPINTQIFGKSTYETKWLSMRFLQTFRIISHKHPLFLHISIGHFLLSSINYGPTVTPFFSVDAVLLILLQEPVQHFP
jgi:hypothetical protein